VSHKGKRTHRGRALSVGGAERGGRLARDVKHRNGTGQPASADDNPATTTAVVNASLTLQPASCASPSLRSGSIDCRAGPAEASARWRGSPKACSQQPSSRTDRTPPAATAFIFLRVPNFLMQIESRDACRRRGAERAVRAAARLLRRCGGRPPVRSSRRRSAWIPRSWSLSARCVAGSQGEPAEGARCAVCGRSALRRLRAPRL
jgi:hypothetical protein